MPIFSTDTLLGKKYEKEDYMLRENIHRILVGSSKYQSTGVIMYTELSLAKARANK